MRMLPRFVLVIPYYLLMRTFGLLNTHSSMILAYLGFALPFIIWMMIGFFKEIPIELEEAAMVDGGDRLRVFVQIVLPLAAPGLAATAIFAFILAWNELLFSLVLSGRDSRTLPIATDLHDRPRHRMGDGHGRRLADAAAGDRLRAAGAATHPARHDAGGGQGVGSETSPWSMGGVLPCLRDTMSWADATGRVQP